jgi:hypothetical protein
VANATKLKSHRAGIKADTALPRLVRYTIGFGNISFPALGSCLAEAINAVQMGVKLVFFNVVIS